MRGLRQRVRDLWCLLLTGRASEVWRAVTHRLYSSGGSIGLRRDVTAPSLKGCERAGFAPHVRRVETYRLFRRYVAFAPLSPLSPTAPARDAASAVQS